MEVNAKIEMLRKVMKERNIDAFIIPSSDNHGSEYVSEYFRVREWISGFTGSAGIAVITDKEAHLWTDGRYFLQAENELKGSEFILEKMGEPGVKTYVQWILDNVKPHGKVSFNGKVFTTRELHSLIDAFSKKHINIEASEDVFNELWSDRPAMPDGKVFIHDLKYCGKSYKEKYDEVKSFLNSEGIDNYLLASLDDIAWLLNLRGSDVECNTVFLSYLLITNSGVTLYIDSSKLTEEVKAYLSSNNIAVKEYEEVVNDLKNIEGRITFDADKTNVWLKESIPASVEIVERRNITTELKAVKNETEIKSDINAHVKDGVAMVKFLKWLKENVGKEEITEISAADKLEAFRKEQENFVEISFNTIAGYGEHGAIIHYKASEDTNVKLQPKGLFLVDSGAQYLDGTTDITRTIALGELTEEEIQDYTLVLKGHLDLGNALFLEGTPGCSLDILARNALWNRMMDFKHGTGHGVGFFLNVHEGPHSIRRDINNVPLMPGMIMSNEPGLYRAGKHGIRIENLIAVERRGENDFGSFLGFRNLTLCPYELSAIDKKLLTADEINWLNDYHKRVYETLAPFLNSEEQEWLRKATAQI